VRVRVNDESSPLPSSPSPGGRGHIFYVKKRKKNLTSFLEGDIELELSNFIVQFFHKFKKERR